MVEGHTKETLTKGKASKLVVFSERDTFCLKTDKETDYHM